MRPVYRDAMTTVYAGDCRNVLPALSPSSAHALVTDPPAGIGFLDLDWDRAAGRGEFVARLSAIFGECRRVLRPGAHALVWALPRTSHWTATALEDAGFEVRDVITHIFGTGIPKSLDCGRVDPAWSGWGTALKPAGEHWILGRAPLAERTVALNLARHETGALHVDACRVHGGPSPSIARRRRPGRYSGVSVFRDAANRHDLGLYQRRRPGEELGRWPANIVLSHLPQCADECVGGCPVAALGSRASFFYAAKPSPAERVEAGGHPTLKGLALMRHLCALVTPADGVVLDPFAGSGSTLLAARSLGLRSVGIEREPDYLRTLLRRVHAAARPALEAA